MRILYVVTGLSIGGAERQVAALAGEMIRRGHEVAIASLTERPAEGEVPLPDGTEVYSLGMGKGSADPRGVLALGRIVRRFRPDVVHAHMIHSNILCRAARLAVPMRRLVCTAHSDIETASRSMRALYRATDPLCEVMTNVSEAAAASFVRQGICRRSKIRCVYDGVSLSRYSFGSEDEKRALRLSLGIRQGGKVVAYAGRLEAVKGCDILAEAIRLIRGRGREDIGFAIFGDGSLRESFLAGLEGVAGVKSYGMIADLAARYRAADVFAMPSRNEGFGLSLVEAMSSGLDAVVSDCAGPREILGLVDGGRIVPREDPEALAEAIIAACDDGAPLEALEARARKLKDLFDLPIICDTWESLYRDH